jgi:hypothetical protein
LSFNGLCESLYFSKDERIFALTRVEFFQMSTKVVDVFEKAVKSSRSEDKLSLGGNFNKQ